MVFTKTHFSISVNRRPTVESDDDEIFFEFHDPQITFNFNVRNSDDDEIIFGIPGQTQTGRASGLDDTQDTVPMNETQDTLPQHSTDDTHDTLPQVDISQDTLPHVDSGDASTFTVSDQLRSILPDDWDTGVDGLGRASF